MTTDFTYLKSTNHESTMSSHREQIFYASSENRVSLKIIFLDPM